MSIMSDSITTRLKLARRALSRLPRREREAELDSIWGDYRLQAIQRNLQLSPECGEELVELARAEALIWQALADRQGEGIILSLAIGMADAFIPKGEHLTLRTWNSELRRVVYDAEHGSGAPRAA
jgi:hypothetical protein